MAVFPKVIYRISAIIIKIPLGFFAEIDVLILKFIQNFKESRTALKKNNKVGMWTLFLKFSGASLYFPCKTAMHYTS